MFSGYSSQEQQKNPSEFLNDRSLASNQQKASQSEGSNPTHEKLEDLSTGDWSEHDLSDDQVPHCSPAYTCEIIRNIQFI